MASRAGRYFELCKPRVVYLIVFTAVVGMFLAVPGWPPLSALIAGTLGIGLAASSAAAINHLLDQRIDAVMARTRGRPLPSGQLEATQVLVFAAVLCTVSMAMLVIWVNNPHRGADLPVPDRLCHYLYGLAEAGHSAKHCYRWRSRRSTTGVGLDSGNRLNRP